MTVVRFFKSGRYDSFTIYHLVFVICHWSRRKRGQYAEEPPCADLITSQTMTNEKC